MEVLVFWWRERKKREAMGSPDPDPSSSGLWTLDSGPECRVLALARGRALKPAEETQANIKKICIVGATAQQVHPES